MSDTDHGAHGAAAAHGTGHDAGHDDHGHGHDADTLGPIDWTMWTVGLLGVIVAMIMAVGFAMATAFAFA